MSINYKYNEHELIKQFSEYVDKTYEQHYSKDKFQATEFIMDGGHGEDSVSVISLSMSKVR